MTPEIHTTTHTVTTRTYECSSPRELRDVLDSLNEEELESADIWTDVPGGGDYSNQPLDLACSDQIVFVRTTLHSQTTTT